MTLWIKTVMFGDGGEYRHTQVDELLEGDAVDSAKPIGVFRIRRVSLKGEQSLSFVAATPAMRKNPALALEAPSYPLIGEARAHVKGAGT